MKYIIDLDALKNCMDFMECNGKVNGGPLVPLSHVKEFIDAFPKAPAEYHIPPLTINDDWTCGTMEMIMGKNKQPSTGDE